MVSRTEPGHKWLSRGWHLCIANGHTEIDTVCTLYAVFWHSWCASEIRDAYLYKVICKITYKSINPSLYMGVWQKIREKLVGSRVQQ